MGAREDLLEAAHNLTVRGLAPFSPADLIREARTAGSSYPDTTLRTFIVGPMCINSPDNHAVQYRDLERVGRGQYVLCDPEADLQSTPSPTRQPSSTERDPIVAGPTHVAARQSPDPAGHDATEKWYWEGNVQSLIVTHLSADGWRIRRVADTASSEHGVDVEAERDGTRLLIEVKGYPSTVYVRGPKRGQPKSTHPTLQARQYFSHALLSGLLMRSEADETSAVVLAFPDFETYRTLAKRVHAPLREAGVDIWLVSETGEVETVSSR